MLWTGVNNQPTHRLSRFRGYLSLLPFLLLGVMSYGHSQQSSDFDQDGIPDHRDQDQDNDGLLNQAEGYQVLADPSRLDIATYRLIDVGFFADVHSGQQAGARHQYELIDNETGDPMLLQATIISGSTTLNWSLHQSLPKIQLESSGYSAVRWELVDPQSNNAKTINSDLTISDLDSERREQIVVAAQSLIGYSLSDNSALLVSESADGQLIFTATVSTGGEHVAEAVTLHFREQDEVVIEYHSSENTNPVPGLKNNRAGFRHNLNSVPLVNYFPLSQQRDTDRDGIADHRDLDSDNDGVSDVVEAGGIDLNFDGVADGAVNDKGIPVASGNGLLAPDTNEDGIADPYDFSLPAGVAASNTESEDTPAETELDGDNDGLTDLQELRLGTNPQNPDTDGDSVSDAEEVMIYHTDPLSPDVEPLASHTDSDHSDTDNDGITDNMESLSDHDGDGVPNQYDLDSDNDGIADVIEAGLLDANGDGLADDALTDPLEVLPDFDRDGVADFLDIDSDEDGLFDLIEAGGKDQDNNGLIDAFTDTNGDGWDDSYLNSVYFANDTNNNGEADQLEPLLVEQALPQNDALFAQSDGSAQLKTGLKGSGGCVFNPGVVSVDFGLLLLLLCSFMAIGLRYSKGRLDCG